MEKSPPWRPHLQLSLQLNCGSHKLYNEHCRSCQDRSDYSWMHKRLKMIKTELDDLDEQTTTEDYAIHLIGPVIAELELRCEILTPNVVDTRELKTLRDRRFKEDTTWAGPSGFDEMSYKKYMKMPIKQLAKALSKGLGINRPVELQAAYDERAGELTVLRIASSGAKKGG